MSWIDWLQELPEWVQAGGMVIALILGAIFARRVYMEWDE